ncbi:RNA 2'-phosphotransferase [Asanoa sp. NPDC050611]|uniref:RNA 2'-phosphotransferase n=1 Tax=Asanoa sp. NPDC050611 TaxID=3157098 RepID=UPI0033F5A597
MDADLVRVSKRLSAVLRHRPASVGLALDPQGWVDVDTLLVALAAHGTPVTRDALDAVVAGNDKRRFAVDTLDGRDRIRASQGHSVPVALGLPDRPPPPRLFHGTSAAAVPSILRAGLVKGRRHAVHLSVDVRTAHVVGARRSGRVALLVIDAAAMATAGHRFQCSANGVWLTAYVPPTFIHRLDAEAPRA